MVGTTPVVEVGLVSLRLAFPDELLDCLLRLTYRYTMSEPHNVETESNQLTRTRFCAFSLSFSLFCLALSCTHNGEVI